MRPHLTRASATFWFNANPDWGAADNPSDDPLLLQDDASGGPGGSELLSLAVPEQDALYRVAVHIWHADDARESAETVRVYLDGTLAVERGPVLLRDGDLWQAATIDCRRARRIAAFQGEEKKSA